MKWQLNERENHIIQMETNILMEAEKFPHGELNAFQETLRFWQEKYERLLEGHRKLQKVNQGLEDKLLRIVDKFETEKLVLTREVSDLATKLVDAQLTITELKSENEQYKNDCNVAVQLLQCKPSSFMSHKMSTLPSDLQEKVRTYINHRRSRSNPQSLQHPFSTTSVNLSNGHSNSSNNATTPNSAQVIRVPISTFPPTAMVYTIDNKADGEDGKESDKPPSQNNVGPDHVSAAIIAKVLEKRSEEQAYRRYQKCQQCQSRRASVFYVDSQTQTSHGAIGAQDLRRPERHYYGRTSSGRARSESSSSVDSLSSYATTPPSNGGGLGGCRDYRYANETIII